MISKMFEFYVSKTVELWSLIRAGLLVVGILQYRRIRRRDQDLERSELTPPPPNYSVVAAYESLPLSALSRLFGAVSQVIVDVT